MFDSKELQELRIKVARMEEREKMWEKEIGRAKAEAMAEAEKNNAEWHVNRIVEFADKFASLAGNVVTNYPEFPPINITNK